MKNIVESVCPVLFAEAETNVFAVLDGASIPDLLAHLYSLQPEFVCLYLGDLEPDMAEVAPYLVQLAPDSEFTSWLLENGWGKHWGIFSASQADLRGMRRHFRNFLTVYDTKGKPLVFRYYDPRVLPVYLSACNPEELGKFFGPVEFYLLEDQDTGAVLQFRLRSGILQTEKKQFPGDG